MAPHHTSQPPTAGSPLTDSSLLTSQSDPALCAAHCVLRGDGARVLTHGDSSPLGAARRQQREGEDGRGVVISSCSWLYPGLFQMMVWCKDGLDIVVKRGDRCRLMFTRCLLRGA